MQKPTQQLQTHKSKPTSKLEPDKKKNHPRQKKRKPILSIKTASSIKLVSSM